LGYNIQSYPKAKQLWECEISLPVYYSLTHEDLKKVVNAVSTSVNKILK